MQFWLKNQWPSQGQLKTLLVFKVSFHSESSLKTQCSYAPSSNVSEQADITFFCEEWRIVGSPDNSSGFFVSTTDS